MRELDNQVEYWNRIGPGKTFSHPVNFARLTELLPTGGHILDFGCGYGRIAGLLRDHGYTNVIGVDPACAMVHAARARFPDVSFQQLVDTPHIDIDEATVDATLLFAVLTCVPSDDGQRSILREINRVLRPGGLIYISDLWLQNDRRNLERYERGHAKHGTYGVFDLSEGVTVRHHDRRWIESLTDGYEPVAVDEIVVQTMNGNSAKGFQWFGRKRTR